MSDKSYRLFLLQTPFGYTRKDVILIGVGLTAVGVGLKSGLEVSYFISVIQCPLD